jgi:hypothetical protein
VALQQAIPSRPKMPQLNLFWEYFRQGKYDKIVEYLQAGLKNKTGYSGALFDLGNALK